MDSYAATAVALYRESILLNPDLSERSASLNIVGLILPAQGKHTAAETWLQEAIALNRAQSHFHHLGKHLMNLGNLYREIKRFNEAEALLDEGAALIDRWEIATGRQLRRVIVVGWHVTAATGRRLALEARFYDCLLYTSPSPRD